ncbi:hypothetical protein HMPREF0971_02330 [Segatella oris F0302]|uniref:Uncharacterized protein n=1 Tax=Segatella oris F0302 TaxID=649760 RepID=D1QTK1_9BACT|nr:hypothetical protein HMPREF0971_02330 [Segatella oris F0302]
MKLRCNDINVFHDSITRLYSNRVTLHLDKTIKTIGLWQQRLLK